jgi:hypothetical protein
MVKFCVGSFCLLRQNTQDQIKKKLSRICDNLGRVLGRKSFTYSELVQLTHECFGPGKMPWSFAQGVAASVLPKHIDPNENLSMEFLIDQEKLDTALAKGPEPPPEALERCLKMLDDALPALRKHLLKEAKALPHGRGGAPPKLASAADQAKVIDEIKSLRGPGMKLEDVFKRIAQRHGVSASKIKQIWLRAKKQKTPPNSA